MLRAPAPSILEGMLPLWALVPAAVALSIVDRPLPFDGQRAALMLEYRRAHVDPAATDLRIEPRVIVLHYTGGTSADATFRYFSRPRIEAARTLQARAGTANVSAHFLVDRDGTVVRLMPETRMARHCIGLNHVSIGVENVGSASRPLTDAQVEANALLVRHLAGRFPITHLIGHGEARRMEGTPLWRERDPRYRNRKGDPGDGFMRRVRARVADLGLEGPPPEAR